MSGGGLDCLLAVTTTLPRPIDYRSLQRSSVVLPVAVVRRFAEAGKRGQTHLAFLRAYDPLSGGGDARATAIHQLTAEPALEQNEHENRRRGEEIGPADSIGRSGSAPDPPTPDSEEHQSAEQHQSDVAVQMHKAMRRLRQIGPVHVDKSRSHPAHGAENGYDQAPEAESSGLGARTQLADDIGSERYRDQREREMNEDGMNWQCSFLNLV